MNGRMYDYNLGRFLSVDPFIQSPGNTQSVNPYAYIMNNPLAGTDPTGYLAESVCGHHGAGYYCNSISYSNSAPQSDEGDNKAPAPVNISNGNNQKTSKPADTAICTTNPADCQSNMPTSSDETNDDEATEASVHRFSERESVRQSGIRDNGRNKDGVQRYETVAKYDTWLEMAGLTASMLSTIRGSSSNSNATSSDEGFFNTAINGARDFGGGILDSFSFGHGQDVVEFFGGEWTVDESSNAFTGGELVSMAAGGVGLIRAGYFVTMRGGKALALVMDSKDITIALSSLRNGTKLITNPVTWFSKSFRNKHVIPARKRLSEVSSHKDLAIKIGTTNKSADTMILLSAGNGAHLNEHK